MRKPRNFVANLKMLSDKVRQLKDRKLVQLGELVGATGTDALPVEVLAGALLSAVEAADPKIKEEWRKRGATFFLRSQRRTRVSTPAKSGEDPARDGGAQSHPNADRAWRLADVDGEATRTHKAAH
jgi:DNA-binding protein H-NS